MCIRDRTYHANGTKLYYSRIIPFKGSWMEFTTDINNVMYAYIDRKKKLPLTTLLRAIAVSYTHLDVYKRQVPSPHQNIINPEPGVMVYDATTKQLAVFNGKVWSFWKP